MTSRTRAGSGRGPARSTSKRLASPGRGRGTSRCEARRATVARGDEREVLEAKPQDAVRGDLAREPSLGAADLVRPGEGLPHVRGIALDPRDVATGGAVGPREDHAPEGMPGHRRDVGPAKRRGDGVAHEEDRARRGEGVEEERQDEEELRELPPERLAVREPRLVRRPGRLEDAGPRPIAARQVDGVAESGHEVVDERRPRDASRSSR